MCDQEPSVLPRQPSESINMIENIISHVMNVNSTEIVQIPVRLARLSTPACLDSGAAVNCISASMYEKINADKRFKLYQDHKALTGAGGSTLNILGYTHLPISIGDKSWTDQFYVIPQLSQHIIIGASCLKERSIDLINSDKCVRLRSNLGAWQIVPYINDRSESKQIARVLVLDEAVEIPPQCECIVRVNQPRSQMIVTSSDPILVESLSPCVKKRGTFAARGIASLTSGSTLVSLANLGLSPVKLQKGTPVAQFTQLNKKTPIIEIEKLPESPKANNKDEISQINILVEELQSKYKDIDDSLWEGIPLDLDIGLESLPKDRLRCLIGLLHEYRDLFADDKDAPSHVAPSMTTHHIRSENAAPISCAPRRVSPMQRNVIKNEIQKMLNAGIIRPSESPWSSPVVLVPKKDGSVRFAIDYRKLNSVTTKDVYALPLIDDTLDSLSGACFFSTLDLASGYWQVPVSEIDKQKTAFVSHEGLFEYNVMPFGLCNAPATFQRMMDNVLAGLKWQSCLVYLDDIIIYSDTIENHIKDLKDVFERLRKANLKLKSSKCKICCEKVPYLGFVISKEGLRADPSKLKCIREWPRPRSKEEVHSFLGLIGYYRKLIKNLTMVEHPMRKLITIDEPFTWQDEQDLAFQTIKSILLSDRVLKLPDFSGKYPFELQTDASDIGIGAVLSQKDEHNNERVIQFASRTLSKREMKWHTQEKEALAIVWAVECFRPYLQGTHFNVKTDHQSLQSLWKADKGRLARWALRLSEFEYTIKHKPGKENGNADALSRLKAPPAVDEWDDGLPGRADLNELPVLNIVNIGTHTNGAIVSIQKSLRDRLIRLQDKSSPIKELKSHLMGASNARPPLHQAWTRSSKDIKIGIMNDLVCRVVGRAPKEIVQVMVPFERTLRLEILRLSHDHPMSGHFGVMRSTHRLLSHFFWPGITSDIKRFIKGCRQCSLRKTARPIKYEAPLRPTVPSAINARVGIDLVGPLPLTESARCQYLCVMIDYFSKWPEAIPIKDKSAESVSRAIYNTWYCRHGIPYEIHTDQGPEFTNELLRRLNGRMGVESRFTTPYNPQANGEVERFNRTLVDALSAYVSQCPGTWDKFLQGVLFAYRTTPHPATGESPFVLMHGREARLPLDVIKSSTAELLTDINEHKLKLTIDLKKAHQIVKEKLKEAAVAMKKQWDSHLRDPQTFEPGDRVLLYQPQINAEAKEAPHSQKFKGKWKGPYEIMEKRFGEDGSIYRIRNPDTHREFSINVNKLRKCNSQTLSLKDPVPSERPRDGSSPGSLDSDARAEVAPLTSAPVSLELDPAPGTVATEAQGDPELSVRKARPSQRKRSQQRRSNDQGDFIEAPLERIIEHTKKRRILYRVRWEGHGPDRDSWLPLEAFYTRECLEDYWRSTDCPLSEVPRMFRYLRQAPPERPAKRLRRVR